MKTKLAIALLALTQILSWAQITNGGVAVLINRTNRSVLNSGFWPSNAIAMSSALSGIGFTGGGGSMDTNRFVSTNHTGDIWLNGRRIFDAGYATGFEGQVLITDQLSVGIIEAVSMTLGDVTRTQWPTYTFANTNATLSFYTNGSTVLLGTNVVGGAGGSITNLTNGAYLADFGGVGDGRKLNGISVVSGVVTAPSGTFSASDTNKLFLLYLDSTNLTSTLTRISNYSSSTTVTLTDTGITTSSKDAVFGTDNTTAMSNALASLRYSGGTIHIKKGVYLFGSSHRSASGANTTIRMPVVAYSAPTNETVTFRISGEHQPPMTYWVNNNGVPWYGTVLMDVATPTANQTNAFFEDFTQADVFSPIRTKFENLTIRSVPNPKRTALLWKRGGGLHVQDCTFDADISEGYIPNTLGEPIYYPPSAFGSTGTNNLPTNAFAIYGPEVYNSGDYRIRDTSISYWPNSIYAQEHTFIDNLNLTANTLGIYAQAGSSSSVSIGKIFFFCMQYPVYAAPLSLGAQNQRIYFDVKDFGIENHDDWPLPAPPGDGLGNFFGNSPITDVSNRLSGTIANLYGSAYVDLKAFSHPGLEVKNNFKAATYSVPENRIGSNRTLVVEGALASPLGAARKSLLVDVPFSEGSGQYVRSYAPGFHVFGAAPGTSPATWLSDDQGGRPGVQMLPNTNSAYAMTYDWEETNYFTFNIIYSSTATNATNNLISPYYRQLHSSTNGLAYHTGFGRWIYYKNNMHDGVVRMVTATYGTNGCALYVNGVEVGRTNLAYPPGQHRMSLLFGTEFGGANLNAHRYQCWKGVLSSNEIKGLAMAEGLWNTTDGGGLTNLNLTGVSITNGSLVSPTTLGTLRVTNIEPSIPLNLTIRSSGSVPGDIFIRGGDADYGDGADITLQGGLAGSGGRNGMVTLSSNVLINGTFTNNGNVVVSGSVTVTNFVGANTVYAGNLRLRDNSIWNTSTGKEIIVKPNATGALQADDTGNSRGDYANDFQRQRTTNTQVAAGANSVILGGSNNRTANSHSVVVGGQDNYASTHAGVVAGMSNSASANYSFVGGGFTNAATATHSAVLGGSENTAGGAYSSVIGGRHGKTTKQGEISHASGQFTQRGDAQHMTFVLRGTTSTNETTRTLTVNGNSPAGDLSNMLVIPAETVWMFEINLAVQKSASGAGTDGGGWNLMGVIRRNAAGSTVLAQNVHQQSWKESGIGTADVVVTADDTNETLKIEVQEGNNTTQMRWVAVVRITQVSWGTP